MTIVVAGHTGLVGSAVYKLLLSQGESVIGINTSVLNLEDEIETLNFFHEVKPQVVIDAAALVGGIIANSTYPVEFLIKNLKVQNNLMNASHAVSVERFIFLGSSCIYPRDCEQPIREEYLMTGPLESSNSAYAIAKIAGIELVRSYRREYGHHWISLMPTNTYGPNDNFNVESAHVLPSLINKFVTAADEGIKKVELWGTGVAKREFIHSDDLASAIVLCLEKYDHDLHLNLGSGQEFAISDLANLVSNSAGYEGEILWDPSKPDGTPRKSLDISRLLDLGWQPKVEFGEGLRMTIDWFRQNRDKARL